MKVYELMSKLEKLPCGAEVVCSGINTIYELELIEKDERGANQYQVTKDIVDVDLEGNHAYLQF